MAVINEIIAIGVHKIDPGAGHSHPHISFFVLANGIHGIIAQAGGIDVILQIIVETAVLHVHGTQSAILCTDPEVAMVVLIDRPDGI